MLSKVRTAHTVISSILVGCKVKFLCCDIIEDSEEQLGSCEVYRWFLTASVNKPMSEGGHVHL